MYRIQWGLVDVRDVAIAHMKALACENNERVIVSSSSMWCRDIGLCLAEEFGDQYRFSTEEVKFCMMRFLGSFFKGEDAEMTAYKNIWGKSQEYSNQKSIKLLGMKYMDIKESLKEQVKTMVS